MKLKKYIAKNMNEALTKIKYDLGKDAVIISQRKVKKPGVKGFFSSKVLEVTVAVDETKRGKNMPKKTIRSLKNDIGGQVPLKKEIGIKDVDAIKALLESASESLETSPINKKEEDKKDKVFEDFTASLQSYNRILSENQKININNKPKYEEIKDKKENKEDYSNISVINEVKEMKAMIEGLVNGEDFREKKEENEDPIAKLLLDNDIEISYVNRYKEILASVDEDTRYDKLKDIISEDVGIFTKTESKAVVLVGPTGVGKTTTIAKLAGRYSLVEGKKVGLITIDTYRIGAVEQLKTYSEIMNIPFKVVFTIKDMESAIDELNYCDIILIDTTGRSSKNTMQISELRAFVDKVVTENVYLVLSATTKNKDLKSIIEGYKQLKYNSIILTKLDETTTYGSLLNVSKLSQKPIGYITTGQGVPDDIKIPSKDEIIRFILGEDKIC